MVIGKSISITGVEGAGIDDRTSGDTITINAGPNDKINLTRLTIDGLGRARRGISLNRAGSLTITHCVVRNFTEWGIGLLPNSKTRFLIGDTLVSDNAGVGISVAPLGTATAIGTLDHVLMNKNGTGIAVNGGVRLGSAKVTSVDSLATNNTGVGFDVRAGGLLLLTHSAALGNRIEESRAEVVISPDGVGLSFGNNSIGSRSGILSRLGTE